MSPSLCSSSRLARCHQLRPLVRPDSAVCVAMDEFLAYEFVGFAHPLADHIPVPGGLLQQRASLLVEDLIV
jgi:hypothetical protein